MKNLFLILFLLCSFFSFSQETENKDVVAFALVETVPIYPKCEKKKGNQAKKECFSEKISEFVNKKFNVSVAKDFGLVGMQRINVIFKINREGEVIDIRAMAPHPELEKEAIRVISLLPKMEPGTQKGKPVIVPYSLPIVFKVQGENKKEKDPFDDPFFNKTGNK